MIGKELGPYRVLKKIGEGGMGEVYQARDERLEREVALKVLPPELVANPERRRRFVQEAQLASKLHHPHIVTIFDIGSADGIDYLAMELVKGRTMDALIPQKGLRLPDALRYAVQITDALAAAHAAGIVHRDLKPSNIMVTDQGQIKILDFGLATLTENVPLAPPNAADVTRAHAPVVETGEGMILGTVAYMSPEQAEGQSVDSRSDIFSFGAIMYEMLSGQRAFKANSTPGTLAAVINLEPPPLTAVSPTVPLSVERLVSRCLRKDVSRRSQHASDIKLALEELQEETSSASFSSASVSGMSVPPAAPAPASPRVRSMTAPLIVGGLVVLAIGGAMAMWWRPATAPSAPTPVVATPLTSLPGSEINPTFSPDASQVAFMWTREGDTKADAYVQLIGSTSTPLRLTDDDSMHGSAAWSPDGKSIALWHGPRGWSGNVPADIRLVLVSPLGGAERLVLEWNGAPRRIAWSPDGRWLAVSPVGVRALRDKGITLISPSTGERVEWAAIDKSYAGSTDPAFSADGRRMVYLVQRDDFTADVFVAVVGAGGRPEGQPVRVANAGQSARLPVWTADGEHLLLVNGAQSSNGSVVRVRVGGSEPFQLVPGLERPTSLGIARDGKRLAISRGNLDGDIWRVDLGNPAASGPIVRSTLHEEGADYSPDGKRIVFSSNRSGAREIWVADITGENALALTQFGGPIPGSARWSPDGREVVFDGRPAGNSEIFAVSASGGAARQLTKDPGEDARPMWSHDGRWIYFSSTRSGQNELWRMSPTGADPVQITKTGAVWSAASVDGQWLYHTDLGGSRLHRIRPDGTDASVIVDDLTFAVRATASGVWFFGQRKAGQKGPTLKMLRFADNTIRDVAELEFAPTVVGMSVSPDERSVLVTRPDTNGLDLLLVDDFR